MFSMTSNRKELRTFLYRATSYGLNHNSILLVLALSSLQMHLGCNMLQLHLCARSAL